MAETTKKAAEWLIHSMSDDDLAALALELDGGSIDEFTDTLNNHCETHLSGGLPVVWEGY